MSTIIICQIFIYKISLITRFPVDVLIAISFIPALGFIFGFLCSWIVREPPRARRTIMLETGLKNAQICLAIMLVTFPAEKVGVLMMMPIYFVVFQVSFIFFDINDIIKLLKFDISRFLYYYQLKNSKTIKC